MWCLIFVLGTFSGPVISQADDVAISSSLESHVINNLTDDHEAKRKMSRQLSNIDGCPSEIPIIENGKIVAARIWYEQGNNFPELSCNGEFGDWNSGIKFSNGDNNRDPVGSIFVNPGCHVIIFKDYQFTGVTKNFPAGLYPNPKKEGPIINCDVPCISSFLFSCQQTYPTCTPTEAWETVTQLDNSDSTLVTTFTYQKTVGTTFSESMQKSFHISASVTASVEASFFDVMKAAASTTVSTGFDWTKTDTTTRSKSTSFTVQVDVPAGVKMSIQDAVGTCGGSKVHTQLFRILDTATGKVVKTMQGRVDKHSLSREDFL